MRANTYSQCTKELLFHSTPSFSDIHEQPWIAYPPSKNSWFTKFPLDPSWVLAPTLSFCSSHRSPLAAKARRAPVTLRAGNVPTTTAVVLEGNSTRQKNINEHGSLPWHLAWLLMAFCTAAQEVLGHHSFLLPCVAIQLNSMASFIK